MDGRPNDDDYVIMVMRGALEIRFILRLGPRIIHDWGGFGGMYVEEEVFHIV